MDAGLVASWDILEYSLNMSAAKSRSGTTGGCIASASLSTSWCPDWLTTLSGILLECYTTVEAGAADATGVGLVTCSIPDILVYQTQAYTGGYQASLSARLEFDDVRIYITNAGGTIIWKLVWTAIRFYAGGTLVWTGAAGDLTSENVTPVGIPLFGIPAELRASAGVNPLPTLGATVTAVCVASSGGYSATSTVSGGWRFQETGSGVWSALPVTYADEPIPAIACGVTATTEEPTVTDTTDAVVTAYASVTDETVEGDVVTDCNECSNGAGSGWEFTPYHRSITYETRGAAILLLPDLVKSVERMCDAGDYSAIIGRYGFPSATRQASAACHDYRADLDTATGLSETEVFPEHSTFLSRVEDAAHTIEDPFLETSFAPYYYDGFKYRGRGTCVETTGVGICPAPGMEEPPAEPPEFCGDVYDDAISHTVTSTFSPEVQDAVGAGGNPDMSSGLYHVDDLARWVNYCCHPHWSYQYWVPPNIEDTDGDGLPDEQETWPLDGNDVANEYYLDTRSQWQTHPDLPGAENCLKRNSLVSAPLRDGALSLLLKFFWFGTESSWWGITRFKSRDLTPLASWTLDADSASLWTAVDATLTHGADITVDPSATTCTVILDIGSQTVEPYFYPHLAKQIAVDWLSANVVSVDVYLRSIDGSSEVLLTSVQGTFDKPLTAGDLLYAGSWKQDHGAFYILDEGADTLVSGASNATMTSVERSLAFSLLNGQQAYQLRFEIEVVSAAVDMTLKYPTFYAPTTAPFVYQENGHQSNVVWADGPGVRFGSWQWWDYVGVTELTTPTICEPGTRFALQGHKSSVLDILRWENLVIQAKGYDTDITSNIAALYDSVEGQTKAKAAYDTIAFHVKSR